MQRLRRRLDDLDAYRLPQMQAIGVDIDVLVRILRLSVSGGQQANSDETVRDFRDRLRASDFLGPRIENIGVSQKSETFDGQDVVSYEISCVLKPGF